MIPIEIRQSQSLESIMERHSIRKSGRSMTRLTIHNQAYRQNWINLTKTGRIRQSQLEMELTAVPSKHNRYQTITKLHQATRINRVSLKSDSIHTEQSQSIELIIRSEIRQSQSLKSIMERHKVRAKAVAQ